ncbi:MAG: 30S ribosomal protein S27ae [Promethearchaeota archaeon]
MPKKKKVKKKEKKKRVHRPNKSKLWEIKDGHIVRTNKTCPRCGPGVYLARHYDRESCGRCGYTRYITKTPSTRKGVAATQVRRRRRLQR